VKAIWRNSLPLPFFPNNNNNNNTLTVGLQIPSRPDVPQDAALCYSASRFNNTFKHINWTSNVKMNFIIELENILLQLQTRKFSIYLSFLKSLLLPLIFISILLNYSTLRTDLLHVVSKLFKVITSISIKFPSPENIQLHGRQLHTKSRLKKCLFLH
jgi:hypothetical protein